jgi:hypothetical protein
MDDDVRLNVGSRSIQIYNDRLHYLPGQQLIPGDLSQNYLAKWGREHLFQSKV